MIRPPLRGILVNTYSVFRCRGGDLLLLLLLAAVAIAPYPLSNDGACHVYNGMVTRALLDGSPPFTRYLHLGPIVPNLFTAAVLTPLSAVASPGSAAKAMIIFTLVLLFVSCRTFFRSVAGIEDTEGLGWLSCFFAVNWFVWMGFWNFCIGTAFALFMVSCTAMRLRRPAVGAVFVLCGAAGITGLTHTVPGLWYSGLAILLWIEAGLFAPGDVPLWKRYTAAQKWMLLPALLPLAMAAVGSKGALEWFDLRGAQIVQSVLYFPADAFEVVRVPFLDGQYGLAWFGALILVAGMEWRRAGWRLERTKCALLAGAVGLLAARLVLADGQAGGAFVKPRLSFYALLLFVAWAWPKPRWSLADTALRGLCVVSIIGSVLGLLPVLRGASDYDRELVAAGAAAGLEAGDTVITIRYAAPVVERRYGLHRLRIPYVMAQGMDWIVAEHRLVQINNNQF